MTSVFLIVTMDNFIFSTTGIWHVKLQIRIAAIVGHSRVNAERNKWPDQSWFIDMVFRSAKDNTIPWFLPDTPSCEIFNRRC